MRFPIRLLLVSMALLPFVGSPASAAETLDSVLARAAAQQRVAVDYREVRHMQLLTKPWWASGHMFIDAGRFVMEQQKPYRLLIVTSHSLYWLYIPSKYFHRTGMVSNRMGAANLGLFYAIMRGDRQRLEQKFNVHFTVKGREWRIALHPKQSNGERYRRIIVEGGLGRAPDTMKIDMPDGDSTSWFFVSRAYTAHTAATVNALVAEAKGG